MKQNQISAFFSILVFALLFCTPALSATPDEYEPDNTIETAKQIFPNGIREIRNFYSADDEDWVKFDVKKGNYYKLVVNSPGEICNPAIEVYDNNKEIIMLVNDYGMVIQGQAEFIAKYDSVYYARIRQCNKQKPFCHVSYGEGTEYYLTLIMPSGSPDKYEPDDTIETAKKILLNQMVSESQLPPGYEWEQIHNFYAPGDEDWIKFDVRKDYVYNLTASFPGKNCDPVIEIYDNNKQLIKSKDSWGLGRDESAEFIPKSDGVYYARIRQCDINDPYCKASYGEYTEYHLSLNMSIGDGDGFIFGAVTPNVPVTIITSDSTSNFHSNAKGEFSFFHKSGTYTFTFQAAGYEDFQMPITVKECPPAGCNTEDTYTKVNICLKPLNSCFPVGGDLTLNFCADYMNSKLGVTLTYNTDGKFWSLNKAIPVESSYWNYINVDNDLKISSLCVQLDGQKYQIALNSYPDKKYWKLPLPGDANNDNQVDLKDAIHILRIITDISVTEYINLNADVNSDKKIGIEDLIYVLQKVAVLRN